MVRLHGCVTGAVRTYRFHVDATSRAVFYVCLQDELDKLIADSLPQRAASIIVTRHGSSMKASAAPYSLIPALEAETTPGRLQ